MLAKLGMPFFQALATEHPDQLARASTRTRRPARTTSRAARRSPDRAQAQPLLPRASAPRTRTRSIINVNTNLDQSLLQVKPRSRSTTTWAACPPSAPAQLAKDFGVNKGRFFVNQLVETDYVALNTSPADVRPGRAPQGRQLRGRPPGDAPPARRVRRQADRPDPASGHGRLPRRRRCIRSRARTTPKAKCSGRQQVRLDPPRHDDLGRRSGARAGAEVQLHADGLRREHQALPGLPALRRRRHEGRALRRRHRGLEPGLPGSVRLHRHPAERSEHSRGEQQQPRLLERSQDQQA